MNHNSRSTAELAITRHLVLIGVVLLTASSTAAVPSSIALKNGASEVTVANGEALTSASIASSRPCYTLQEQFRGPRKAEMPGICRALLQSLNSACASNEDPYQLTLSHAADDVTDADWEPIVITPATMLTIERVVRGRFGTDSWPPLNISGARRVWLNRGDQDWEIVQRSIEMALEQGHPVIFERADVRVTGRDKPTTFYRLRIEKDPASLRALVAQPDNQIDLYIHRFGVSPEIYPDDPVDYAAVSGSNSILIYRGTAFPATVVNHSADVGEIVVAPRMLIQRDVCRLSHRNSVPIGPGE